MFSFLLSQDKKVIAVADIESTGINEIQKSMFFNQFESELVQTQYYIVTSRSEVDKILKEQKFQKSGCVSDECIVEIGKMIGVNQIVGGSISQVGNVYSVSARIVNVETGEIENIGLYDHTGNIGELLTGGMKRVAVELVK